MNGYRHNKRQRHVTLAEIGIELGQREVVTHDNATQEVHRHREQCSYNGNRHYLVEIIEQIEHILEGRKAQSHTGAIDYAIELLVEMTIATQDQPQEK